MAVGAGVAFVLLGDQSLGFSEIGKGGEYVGSIAAIVQRNRWCEYRIEAGRDLVKVISNASVRSTVHREEDEDKASEYGLRYQLLNQEQEIVADERVFLQSRKVLEFSQSLWKFVLAEEFGTTQVAPLSPRLTLVPLHQLKGGDGILRLCCDSGDENVVDLCVRVYARQVTATEGGTAGAVDGNGDRGGAPAYVDGAAERAKKGLAQGRSRVEWISLGPRGIRGKDYQQRRILVCKGRKTRADEEPIQRVGFYVPAGRVGVVRDEEPVEASRWEVYPRGGLESFAMGETARIRLWKADGEGRREYAMGLDREGVHETIREAARGFEIEASTDIVVRVFASGDGGEREITPQNRQARFEILESGHDRLFALKSGLKMPLVVRIEARGLWTRHEVPEGESGAVWYAIVGEGGAIHGEGQIPVGATADVRSWPEGDWRDWQVSEASVCFVEVPPEARTLCIVARDRTVMVACQWNTVDFSRTVRVPGRGGIQGSGGRRAAGSCVGGGGWLPLVPGGNSAPGANWNDLAVAIQEKGFGEEEDKQAHTLVRLAPEDAFRTCDVLVPARVQERVDRGSRAENWMGFATGKSYLVKFGGGMDSGDEEMAILWPGENTASGRVALRIDGAQGSGPIPGSARRSPGVGPAREGWHELAVDGPEEGMVLASGIVEGTGRRYWRRICYGLDRPVSVSAVKESAGNEVVVARVYVNRAESRGARVSVNLVFERSREPVLGSWTSKRSVYELEAPPGGCPGDSVTGASEYMCERAFQIVLGSDVLPGPYSVTIQHEEGAECLVHLARRVGTGDLPARSGCDASP